MPIRRVIFHEWNDQEAYLKETGTEGAVESVVAIGGLPRALPSAVELDELMKPETAAENGTLHRVTAQLGETVLLPCKAYSLGQRTVSLSPHINVTRFPRASKKRVNPAATCK